MPGSTVAHARVKYPGGNLDLTYNSKWSMASESLPPESPSSTRSPFSIMPKSFKAWFRGLRILAGGLASFLDRRLDRAGSRSSEFPTVAIAVDTPVSGSGSSSSSMTFSAAFGAASPFSLSDPEPPVTSATNGGASSASVASASPSSFAPFTTHSGAARFCIKPPRTFSVLSVTRSGCLRLVARPPPETAFVNPSVNKPRL